MFKMFKDMLSTVNRKPERDFMVVSKYMKDADGNVQDVIRLPNRGTKYSAGYDFYNNTGESIKIGARESSFPIPTGVKVYMKPDEVLEIYPRSSLGFKHDVRLSNTIGIIDSDYFDNEKNEGEIFIKLFNPTRKIVNIGPGEAFAQGLFKNFLTSDTDATTVGGKRVGGIGSTSEEK